MIFLHAGDNIIKKISDVLNIPVAYKTCILFVLLMVLKNKSKKTAQCNGQSNTKRKRT